MNVSWLTNALRLIGIAKKAKAADDADAVAVAKIREAARDLPTVEADAAKAAADLRKEIGRG